MTLRPYQAAVIESARRALTTKGSVVIQMPTGAGKTKVASAMLADADGTAWFICHRVEILRQAAKAFAEAGIEFGIVSPAIDPETRKPYPFEPHKRVQIVSIGALKRRIADLPLPTTVFWDECHHVPAKSWAAIREALVDAKHIGLTATPERLDGKGLSEWFEELVVGPTIETLVKGKFLSPFRYFAPSEPDLTAAKLQAGDYHKKDADAVMNTPVLIGDAVAEYRRVADGKRAIAFCTSREASKALADRFNAEGIPACHVDGKTDDDERRAAIESLAAGDIKVLSNVEVFTEGVDVPGIEAAILMRPTKSPTLLLQMIGRALRPVVGKMAIIMDHAGLHREHGLPGGDWHWSIDGGAAKARRIAGQRGPRVCPKCKEARAEREPVCATCGFEFPTGREIGEYDGVLHEVRGEVPEGWAAPGTFMKIIGVGGSTVASLIRQGLPNDGGLIPIEDGKRWVKENWAPTRHPPIGVDSPDEWISGIAFCEMVGLSQGALSTLAGLPGVRRAKNGWIHAPSGIDAVKGHYSSPASPPKDVNNPEEYEPKNHFARRIGRNVKLIDRWALDPEFPNARNGWVHVERGLEWANGEAARGTREKRLRTGTADDYVVLRAAAARYRKSSTGIKPWFADGMPAGGILSGDFSASDEWVKQNRFREAPPLDVPDPENYERPDPFAKMMGASSGSVVEAWESKGMRRAPNGWVHVPTCREWVSINWHPTNVAPRDVSDPAAYCSTNAFGRMIGKHGATIAEWRKKGLPCASNGWVHIQRGLEWIRDNTNIVIPPESWPTANDNAAPTKRAA